MITIDEILFKIELHGVDALGPSVPFKDKKILKNLCKLIKLPSYITENQSKLLIKILQENMESLNFIGTELIPSLRSPSWSKNFKILEVSKTVNIVKTFDNEFLIDIEFSSNKNIKRDVTQLQKELEGTFFDANGRHYRSPLTEKNLFKTVQLAKKYDFEISPQILKLYGEICEIDQDFVKAAFNIQLTDNKKMKEMVSDDIGLLTTDNYVFLQDRKIAYQYTIHEKRPKIQENSLISKIAHRKNNKIFINKTTDFKDLLSAIKDLKRNPLLLVFDEYNTRNCIENIKLLKNTLDELGVTTNVGIYFRFPNESDGLVFNQLIAEYGYNKALDLDNEISVISNGKIPKFFLKTEWYPKATITFSNQLRNNKTSVYCNECDLIVYYNTTVPVSGNIDVIV
jgi:hypothetical protein